MLEQLVTDFLTCLVAVGGFLFFVACIATLAKWVSG
jgi:preprotein translocase subunit SecE